MMPKYEEMLSCLYDSILRSGDVAVDIGAHVGLHTVSMARAVRKNGKVFCFEPLPSAFEKLDKLVADNKYPTAGDIGVIIPYMLALGDEEGSAQFVHVPAFPEYSGFKERVYHVDGLLTETISVEVKKLDSFKSVFGRVRYIKIDAEGGELSILKGGREVILGSMPIISFEMGNAALVNYSYSAADYFDFFYNIGYNLFSIFGIPLSREHFLEMAERQYFWDYIAVSSSESWAFNHEHIWVLIRQLYGCEES